MREVTFSMSMSADGYIADPRGDFQWSRPDPALFRFATDEVRGLGVHVMGRRLYEAMSYWETAEQDHALNADELVFGALWKALPKVVFSTTLTEVRGSNTRLATAGLAEEIAQLRADTAEGNIGIGGAELAAAVADLGLIDEYRVRIYPVIVGGGTPFFPQRDVKVDLDLLETRVFDSGVTFAHYRVLR